LLLAEAAAGFQQPTYLSFHCTWAHWCLQVRVQVGEEDGQRLFPGVQGLLHHVWDYLQAKLLGLNLAGRPYQFLVYSSR
jgi:hypothetical protein